ncbi:MAG TPA: gamma-glutamyltransferase, partial [Firmicutes bacterium]|nr:gamma-glutamyltransferase [Bacillota bacterium]
EVAPGKRPYHTIIPAMIFRDGKPWASYGVMGGLMQPQGHVQVACNLIDFGMDPQRALDAPRFRSDGGLALALEKGFVPDTVEGLRARGHEVSEADRGNFGGGQIILLEGEVLMGGSDPRKDGAAVGW